MVTLTNMNAARQVEHVTRRFNIKVAMGSALMLSRLILPRMMYAAMALPRLMIKRSFAMNILLAVSLLAAVTGSAVASSEMRDSGNLLQISAVSVSVKQQGQALPPVLGHRGQAMNAAQLEGANRLKHIPVVKTPRKTREQVIADKQINVDTRSGLRSSAARLNAAIYYEFAIYDASTRLFEDIDYDGFYRTFSVTFDADVHSSNLNQYADVYAMLYLSRNGGPWELYHTTEIFTIFDDVSNDDFEVLTTLHSGYPTDHYDVLIDLYEVGYSDIVATISSDDLDELYGLPLESADRDFYADEGTEVIVGGAISMFAMLFLWVFAIIRRVVSTPSQ